MRAFKALRSTGAAYAANPGRVEGGHSAVGALRLALPRRIKTLGLALVAVPTFALVGLARPTYSALNSRDFDAAGGESRRGSDAI